jgi:predicted Zn-dependent protease
VGAPLFQGPRLWSRVKLRVEKLPDKSWILSFPHRNLMSQPAQRSSFLLPLFLAAAAAVLALVLLFLVIGLRSQVRELRAMVLSDRANIALNSGAGADAEALLAEVADLAPDTPALWNRRALARMVAGQPTEAAEAARKFLRQNPGDPGMSALLSAAQIRASDFAGAEQTLVSALELNPLQRDLMQNFSELRRIQGRPADAAMIIDQYLAENPGDGFFQYKRAMADVAGDLSDDRREQIVEAVGTGDATAGLYVVAAAIDFKDGNLDAAQAKLEEASRRSGPNEMRTMLEDAFFAQYLQFAPAPGGDPAASPAATGATDD